MSKPKTTFEYVTYYLQAAGINLIHELYDRKLDKQPWIEDASDISNDMAVIGECLEAIAKRASSAEDAARASNALNELIAYHYEQLNS